MNPAPSRRLHPEIFARESSPWRVDGNKLTRTDDVGGREVRSEISQTGYPHSTSVGLTWYSVDGGQRWPAESVAYAKQRVLILLKRMRAEVAR